MQVRASEFKEMAPASVLTFWRNFSELWICLIQMQVLIFWKNLQNSQGKFRSLFFNKAAVKYQMSNMDLKETKSKI